MEVIQDPKGVKKPQPVALSSLKPLDGFYFLNQAESFEEAVKGDDQGTKIYQVIEKFTEKKRVKAISLSNGTMLERDDDWPVVKVKLKVMASEA